METQTAGRRLLREIGVSTAVVGRDDAREHSQVSVTGKVDQLAAEVLRRTDGLIGTAVLPLAILLKVATFGYLIDFRNLSDSA